MNKPSKTPTQEAPKVEGRMCVYIPINGYVEGEGYRVSIVKEGESGHFPTGTWPYEGKPGQTMPWFWGHDYEKAVEIAKEHNAKLGLTERDVLDIISSSITKQSREDRRGANRR